MNFKKSAQYHSQKNYYHVAMLHYCSKFPISYVYLHYLYMFIHKISAENKNKIIIYQNIIDLQVLRLI